MKTYKILDMGLRHYVFEVHDNDMMNLGTHCVAIFNTGADAREFADIKNGTTLTIESDAE